MPDQTTVTNTKNYSDDEDVQALITLMERDDEFDCPLIDDGHRAFMGAVYMDALYNEDWRPSPHLRSLVQEINAKVQAWANRSS